MKKTKRVHQGASGRSGGPTRKRLKHIAGDVMAQERRDRQAERAAKTKRKID